MPSRLFPLLLVLAALAAGCGTSEAACDPLPGVRPGVCITPEEERQAAPTTSAPMVREEGEMSLADLRGKVVVLNFWASWCGPCRREQPELNAAHGRLAGEDVAFLGVDLQESSVTQGREHLEFFDVPYPSLYDPDTSYAARFEGVGPRSIPTTILIDREGRVAARLFGETDAEEVTVLADALLDA